MDFVQPEAWYGLAIIPVALLLVAWSAARRRKALKRMGSPDLLGTLVSNPFQHRRRLKFWLWFLSAVLLVTALARPRWGLMVTMKIQEGVDVIVALDVSTSMLAEDIKPSRLDRAKLAVIELMDLLEGNAVGLVAFSGAAFIQFPLTEDFYTARAFLDDVDPGSISRPGTALEEALRVAIASFPEERATQRVILLLTDGEGHEGAPLDAAQQAAEEGIIVHAIGFGSPVGEPIPLRDTEGEVTDYKKDVEGETVLSKLDEVTLQQIAAVTGGYYFRASSSGEELDRVVQEINKLATGEQATESQFEVLGVERFGWFAGAALVLLIIEAFISERTRPAKVRSASLDATSVGGK